MMLRRVLSASVLVAFMVLGHGCQGEAAPPLPPDTASPATSATSALSSHLGALSTADRVPRALAALAGSYASSVDARGIPTFLWATSSQLAFPGATPEAAARVHLAHHADSLGLDARALESVELVQVADRGLGGVIVRLRQRVDGIVVYRSEARVLMRADLSLVAISGSLSSAEPPGRDSKPFRTTPSEALAASLSHLYGLPLPASAVMDVTPVTPVTLGGGGGGNGDQAALDGGTRQLQLLQPLSNAPLYLPEPAQVKKVYVPDGQHLVAAWFVEFYSGRAGEARSDAFRYVVAADDGRVLHRKDLTSYDFNYRVWAEAAGDKRPLDGPQQDWTPHPTGMPDGSNPGFIPPNLVSMKGFNQKPNGPADPWLSANAVQTFGNNVDAYVDRYAPDGFSNGDFRAITTGAGVFDRVYDLTLAPTVSDGQAMAGITNLFYVTNWLHDWFYDSGFNEAAGNAQLDNFQRGGVAGDVLHAEAQDNVFGGSRNNSNMTTPSDGFSPKMQVFVWSGPETRKLTVTPPGSDLASNTAGFGPTSFNLMNALVLVNDNVGTVTDGCEAIVNNVSGKIALIDRGMCTFKQKVVNAQTAGAIGVLVADNQNGGGPPFMADGLPMTLVTIPVMSVTLADGTAIKAALMNGAVTATFNRRGAVDRDGTLENTVVAHEWGHYLHHRLADCSAPQCSAMSEGWADFTALHMMLRDGDNLDGTYAVAIYAAKSFGDSGYYGIRREPYSVDFSKNGLTFQHISDGAALPKTPLQGGGANSEVHNAGEIWATMLFEGYVALQKYGKAHMQTFDDVRRRMSDYMVSGHQLSPPDATYTETRDAILAAAAARNSDDLNVLAQAFARRGAGTCAVSPPRNSMKFAGVVESYELKPRLQLGAMKLDDSLRSCDGDGYLDADERGNITVAVSNPGSVPLIGTKLTPATTTMGITFTGAAVIDVPLIAPYATVMVPIGVALDKSVTKMGPFNFSVMAANAGSCEGSVTASAVWRINFDDLPATASTDDVESAHTVFTPKGKLSDVIWSRAETMPLNHAWRGIDYGSVSDTWLESPDLNVAAMGDFGMSISHRHSFEAATEMGVRVFYDGAIIEITSDGGATWSDASMYAMAPYGGTISIMAGNPLAGRKALVDKNAAWPLQETMALNFASAFAGKTVRIRFHVGSDQASSDFGWEIDNIAFSNITNKPFASLVDNRGMCGADLTADAGPDQMARFGAAVVLDASKSTGRLGKPITFMWTQTAGPTVELLRPTSAIAAFAAPVATTASSLVFQVTVSDGALLAHATTNVGVSAAPASDGGDNHATPPSSGCGCAVGQRAPGSKLQSVGLLGTLMAIALLRRRRDRTSRRLTRRLPS